MHAAPLRVSFRRRIGPLFFALVTATVISSAAPGQEPLRPRAPSPPPGAKGAGPWDQDIVVYRVQERAEPKKLATFERGGVATVARLGDGRLAIAHQHFPANNQADFDKVAIHFTRPDSAAIFSRQVHRGFHSWLSGF